MTAAIFGLVGVVIGGLLNGGVTLWVERVRERREARAAARLIRDELFTNKSRIDIAIQRGTLFRFGSSTTWHELRPVLARTLDGTTWRTVLAAYVGIGIADETKRDPAEQPREIDLKLMRIAQREVNEALAAIDQMADMATPNARGPVRTSAIPALSQYPKAAISRQDVIKYIIERTLWNRLDLQATSHKEYCRVGSDQLRLPCCARHGARQTFEMPSSLSHWARPLPPPRN